MLAGALVPWIRCFFQPSRSAYLPSGLSGPGGMNFGSGLPFSSSCSSRMLSGGYQGGFSMRSAMVVSPTGVSHSSRPTAAANAMTSRGSRSLSPGKY